MTDVPTEGEVRAAQERGDAGLAVKLAYELLRPKIEHFLRARLANPADAQDALSRWGEMLVTAVPSFEWRASLKTLGFVLARRARAQVLAERARDPGVPLGLSLASALAQPRSFDTLNQIDDEDRRRALELREQLSEEDQEIVALYSKDPTNAGDKRLTWREIAQIVNADRKLEEEELERETERVRQHGSRAVKKLAALGEQSGIKRKLEDRRARLDDEKPR